MLPPKYVGEAISLPLLLFNIQEIVREDTILLYNDNDKNEQNGGSKPPPYVVLIFVSAFIFIVFVIAFGDGERTLFAQFR